MKRFLPLILVVVLVAAMAVPAMAAEETTMRIGGTWQLNENLHIEDGRNNYSEKVTFVSDGVTYLGFARNHMSETLQYVTRFDSFGWAGVSVSIEGVWQEGFSSVVEFLNEQEVSYEFYQWFTSNAVRMSGGEAAQCDGSVCPVTDVDGDYICDECGLPISYSLRGDSTYSYNGLLLPVLPNLDYDAYWVMFPSGDTAYRLVVSSKPFSVENGEVYVYEQTSLVFFAAGHSSSAWSQYSTQNITTKYSVGDAESIVWASHNIANKETGDLVVNGDANFRDPLWMEMEQVTQGEMVELTQTMGGTMTTLLVCGVGLMACLVVLSLFGRRSLIFRR